MRERHARYYAGRLAERQYAFFSPRMSEARDELRGDIPNLRAAAEWAVTQWSDDEARSALWALADFFNVHSWPEGLETFEHLVQHARLLTGSDARYGQRAGGVTQCARRASRLRGCHRRRPAAG